MTMEDDPAIIILNDNNMKYYRDMAKETSDEFEIIAKNLMTQENAEFIRKLRIKQGYTWRAVAAECHEQWKGDWFPHSNQLMGMELCKEASKYFEDNPELIKEGW